MQWNIEALRNYADILESKIETADWLIEKLYQELQFIKEAITVQVGEVQEFAWHRG
jgi:hypothetical protein